MAVTGLVGKKSEEDGVELLILKHPPVNALSTSLLGELDAQIRELAANANARAVILTGDGQFFSAGADLKEMATLGLDRAVEIVRKGHDLFGPVLIPVA